MRRSRISKKLNNEHDMRMRLLSPQEKLREAIALSELCHVLKNSARKVRRHESLKKL